MRTSGVESESSKFPANWYPATDVSLSKKAATSMAFHPEGGSHLRRFKPISCERGGPPVLHHKGASENKVYFFVVLLVGGHADLFPWEHYGRVSLVFLLPPRPLFVSLFYKINFYLFIIITIIIWYCNGDGSKPVV